MAVVILFEPSFLKFLFYKCRLVAHSEWLRKFFLTGEQFYRIFFVNGRQDLAAGWPLTASGIKRAVLTDRRIAIHPLSFSFGEGGHRPDEAGNWRSCCC
ncbi:hypothetical protein [Ferruginibacter sp.]|uniref:hypothetical protein n=1 Tax=Ferruginibacter sp. TaxID=1940288 RepID=UPI002659F7D0|nr:hypothetical protein [Ferruginibacter sp.]